jgi:hypothetical protein
VIVTPSAHSPSAGSAAIDSEDGDRSERRGKRETKHPTPRDDCHWQHDGGGNQRRNPRHRVGRPTVRFRWETHLSVDPSGQEFRRNMDDHPSIAVGRDDVTAWRV